MLTHITTHPEKGRCVHATLDIKEGFCIAVNHVLTYPCLPDGHKLADWSMSWTEEEDALALGHINLLNHSETPNCRIENNYNTLTKRLLALRPIAAGEELTIKYACPVWFNIKE